MRVDRIVTCVDDNPVYFNHWPVVHKAWSDKTGIKPTLFYVGSSEESFRQLRETGLTYWLKSKGPHTAWQATWALFYGQSYFNANEVCMTVGIDQAPLSNRLIESVKDIDEDSYVCLLSRGDWLSDIDGPNRNIASSYHIAKAGLVTKVMEIESSWEREIDKLSKVNCYLEYQSPFHNWGIDETWSTKKLQKYHRAGGVVETPLGVLEVNAHRVSRDMFLNGDYDINKLKAGGYYEGFLPRPFIGHEEEILRVLDAAPNL